MEFEKGEGVLILPTCGEGDREAVEGATQVSDVETPPPSRR